MLILLIVSALLNVIALVLLVMSKIQLRNFTSQLKHSLRVKSRSNIGVMLYQKERIELADSINQLLLRLRDIENQYENLDRHHKQLIASIAHDFRTPLTSMMGYVQLAKEDNGERMQQYLRTIEGRVSMLSHLVDDFYAMSLLDSHEYPMKIQEIRPKRICEEQLVLYYDDLNRVFPSVEIALKGDSFSCQGDEHALERVFSNIIKNALIHGKKSFKISDHYEGKDYVIQFLNGIDENVMINEDRIFERAYKMDQSRTTASSGLGLAIVKELTKQMKIKITVKSSAGTLLFELRFPVN